MAQVTCPWCETELMSAVLDMEEGECSECLTRWRFEEEEPKHDLALAA